MVLDLYTLLNSPITMLVLVSSWKDVIGKLYDLTSAKINEIFGNECESIGIYTVNSEGPGVVVTKHQVDFQVEEDSLCPMVWPE